MPTVTTKLFNDFPLASPLKLSDFVVGYDPTAVSDPERRFQISDIFNYYTDELGPQFDSFNSSITSMSADIGDIINTTIPALSTSLIYSITGSEARITLQTKQLSSSIYSSLTAFDLQTTSTYNILTAQVVSLSSSIAVLEITIDSLSSDLLSLSSTYDTFQTNISGLSSKVVNVIEPNIATINTKIDEVSTSLLGIKDDRYAYPNFVTSDYTVTSADAGTMVLFLTSGATLYLPSSGIPNKMQLFTAMALSGTNQTNLSAVSGAILNSAGTIIQSNFDNPITLFYWESTSTWYAFGNLINQGIYEVQNMGIEVGVKNNRYQFELQNMSIEVGAARTPYVQLEALGIETVITEPEFGIQLEALGVEVVVASGA